MTAGFIGTGNMGGALAKVTRKSAGDELKILLSSHNMKKAQALAENVAGDVEIMDNLKVAYRSDFIFLGVKPQMIDEVLSEISGVLQKRAGNNEKFTLVSVAAGISMEKIALLLGANYPIIRILPNTPIETGKGIILYICNRNADDYTIKSKFKDLLKAGGFLYFITENLMDAASSLTGCSPAYVYMFIEAMADAGVAMGLEWEEALLLSSVTVSGSAQMVLNGDHPSKLKEMVCSPGGTTIEGVRKLEEKGFRSAIMEALIAAYEKNRVFK